MSVTPFPKPVVNKVSSHSLWKEVNSLADLMYDVAASLPESETWYTASKIRTAAVDMLFYTTEALGDVVAISTVEADWSHARKAASALRALYPFCGRQDFLKIDPEIVVRLDALLENMGEQTIAAHAKLEQANDADLDLWREKYRIWKKTDDK